VDRHFRVYDPEHEVRLYDRTPSSIERVNSRLEDLVYLYGTASGVSGTSQSIWLCIIAMLLVALTALRVGVPERVRCMAARASL
jgi:hypothetical protein